MHLVISPYLLFLILPWTVDQTPPNTPQRARIASQRNERDNRVLDSPQHHRVPQNPPRIVLPFQQAPDDVFGGGPIPDRREAQAFLANLNFQPGNAAPQLTPNSVTWAQERLAQLQRPLEFNPAPAPVGRHRPPEPVQQQHPDILAQGQEHLAQFPQFNPGNRILHLLC
ncbi:hypothetical protein B0H19DRAFT_1059994 [Mycena capillaripes]|nr:hypothetical protein B0H19DRAFT_1059994 [Mycena capillaripes]